MNSNIFIRRLVAFRSQIQCISSSRQILAAANQYHYGRLPSAKATAAPPSTSDYFLTDFIRYYEVKKGEDWSHFRKEIQLQGGDKLRGNLDVLIIGACISTRRYDLAEHYVEALKKNGGKLSISVVGKILQMLYEKNVTELKDEQKIIDVYRNLKRDYELLDSITSTHAIYALSLTREWRECLALLENIKLSCTPSYLVYNIVVVAALKSNDDDVVWKLLEEMINTDFHPSDTTLQCYFQQLETAAKDKQIDRMEKMLHFLSANDLKLHANAVGSLTKVCKSLKIVPQFTKITNSGTCLTCMKTIKSHLNEEMFAQIKEKILENVIVGKNVFYRSSPAELNLFQEFTRKMPKYDVVIDGLNVAYASGVKQSGSVMSFLLASVIRYFTMKNKKVLVLGRNHMKRWPNWRQLERLADTFLADSLSQDDPFLLYCAVKSGIDTIIVSKDLMRGHAFKLQDRQLKMLFNQWLSCNQYQLKFVEPNGNVHFKIPPPFTSTLHKTDNIWHIPVEEAPVDPQAEPLIKWLCLKL